MEKLFRLFFLVGVKTVLINKPNMPSALTISPSKHFPFEILFKIDEK